MLWLKHARCAGIPALTRGLVRVWHRPPSSSRAPPAAPVERDACAQLLLAAAAPHCRGRALVGFAQPCVGAHCARRQLAGRPASMLVRALLTRATRGWVGARCCAPSLNVQARVSRSGRRRPGRDACHFFFLISSRI